MHTPAFTSKQGQAETISQWDARMDAVCGDLQRAARKHMEDLAWTNAKGEGGGDIIDLFIRACFIQGLHDDRIKTMVKAKGNVNTPMAQLVEVALEEESSLRSERFKRNIPEKGQASSYFFKIYFNVIITPTSKSLQVVSFFRIFVRKTSADNRFRTELGSSE